MKSNKLLIFIFLLLGTTLFSGCASVPLASKQQDSNAKTFSKPPADKAGLYVFRNSLMGQALKKAILLDGVLIGHTANKIYFYKEIPVGNHTLSTESEFGDNSITFQAEGGKNYYARQYMKMGVFLGGSDIEMVSEDEGKQEVLECELAQ